MKKSNGHQIHATRDSFSASKKTSFGFDKVIYFLQF